MRQCRAATALGTNVLIALAAGKDHAVAGAGVKGTVTAAAYLGERSHYNIASRWSAASRSPSPRQNAGKNRHARLRIRRHRSISPGRPMPWSCCRVDDLRPAPARISCERCDCARFKARLRVRRNPSSLPRAARSAFKPGVAVFGSSVSSSAMRSTWVSACCSEAASTRRCASFGGQHARGAKLAQRRDRVGVQDIAGRPAPRRAATSGR